MANLPDPTPILYTCPNYPRTQVMPRGCAARKYHAASTLKGGMCPTDYGYYVDTAACRSCVGCVPEVVAELVVELKATALDRAKKHRDRLMQIRTSPTTIKKGREARDTYRKMQIENGQLFKYAPPAEKQNGKKSKRILRQVEVECPNCREKRWITNKNLQLSIKRNGKPPMCIQCANHFNALAKHAAHMKKCAVCGKEFNAGDTARKAKRTTCDDVCTKKLRDKRAAEEIRKYWAGTHKRGKGADKC